MTFFHLRIFIYPEYTMIFRVIPIYAQKLVFYPGYAISLLSFPHTQHNNRYVPDMQKLAAENQLPVKYYFIKLVLKLDCRRLQIHV